MGAIYVKDSGSAEHSSEWVGMNYQRTFPAIFAKDGGTWENVLNAWVKDSGSWEKVYETAPSEAWTSGNLPTTAEQTAYDTPDFDGSYPYTNATSANTQVRWIGDVDGTAREMYVSDFGWSPTSDHAFEYGAVTRMEVAYQAQTHSATYFGANMYVAARYDTLGNGRQSNSLTDSLTTYTEDYVVGSGGWEMDDEEAGEMDNGDNQVEVYPEYASTQTGTDETVGIEDIKVRVKYQYVT